MALKISMADFLPSQIELPEDLTLYRFAGSIFVQSNNANFPHQYDEIVVASGAVICPIASHISFSASLSFPKHAIPVSRLYSTLSLAALCPDQGSTRDHCKHDRQEDRKNATLLLISCPFARYSFPNRLHFRCDPKLRRPCLSA